MKTIIVILTVITFNTSLFAQNWDLLHFEKQGKYNVACFMSSISGGTENIIYNATFKVSDDEISCFVFKKINGNSNKSHIILAVQVNNLYSDLLLDKDDLFVSQLHFSGGDKDNLIYEEHMKFPNDNVKSNYIKLFKESFDLCCPNGFNFFNEFNKY